MDDRYGNIYSSDTRLGKSSYNEDYNYAYMSSDNLTPQEVPQVGTKIYFCSFPYFFFVFTYVRDGRWTESHLKN